MLEYFCNKNSVDQPGKLLTIICFGYQ